MKKTIIDDPEKITVERQLLTRLKKMGFLLGAFSLAFFVCAFFAHPSPLDDGFLSPEEETLSSGLSHNRPEDDSEELIPEKTLNFFAIGLVFAGVGIACVLISWKRLQALEAISEDPSLKN